MSILIYSLLALFLGLCLDYVLGDPRGWYHPVMAVGWLTVRLESDPPAPGRPPPSYSLSLKILRQGAFRT